MNNKLLSALETERRYIARELHDTLAQTSLQLGLQVNLALKLLEGGDMDQLSGLLKELAGQSEKISRQVRELIADLRPPEIEPDAALPDLLAKLIEAHHQRGGPPVEFHFEWTAPYPVEDEPARLAFYRLCQEALLNIRKHARASTVHFMLTQDDTCFYLSIADDGRGFDLLEVAERPGDKGGAGLQNMEIRAKTLGAEFSISRNILGAGTKITVTWPKKPAQ